MLHSAAFTGAAFEQQVMTYCRGQELKPVQENLAVVKKKTRARVCVWVVGGGGGTFWDRYNVTELQILHREVHDGGILLNEEVVLGEALEVEHHEARKPLQRVPPPPTLDVIMHSGAIKFVQQLKNGHLHACSGFICAVVER